MQQMKYIVCVCKQMFCVYVCRMDRDGNVLITWEEWREYLMLQPHTSVESIFEHHATVSCQATLCLVLSHVPF